MEISKDMLQLIGVIISIVVPVTSIMLWMIRREISRLDALPKAINDLSKAISKLVRWKIEFTVQSKSHRRHVNTRLCSIEEQTELLAKRIDNLEERLP